MTDFLAFFKIGLSHILDIGGIDHLLFITSILLIYTIADWKIVIRLITAFTIGHVISMALGYYNLIPIPRGIIEFLIPITILTSAIYHLSVGKPSGRIQYVLITLFGVVHGAAYSGEFMSMMGQSPNVLLPLLGFNLGVECAQIIFGVLLLFLLYFIFERKASWRRGSNILIFGIISLVAIYLAFKAWPW